MFSKIVNAVSSAFDVNHVRSSLSQYISIYISISERAPCSTRTMYLFTRCRQTQSTLSGAIDIICIEDGDQMVSTPFHVRFGKLQVLHTNEKMVLSRFPSALVLSALFSHTLVSPFSLALRTSQVSITVNGHTSDVSMKLGKAGEAYFFEESTGVSDEAFLQSRSLSSSLASSPVNGLIMSPPLGALDSVRAGMYQRLPMHATINPICLHSWSSGPKQFSVSLYVRLIPPGLFPRCARKGQDDSKFVLARCHFDSSC
jgi:hypothetical protein